MSTVLETNLEEVRKRIADACLASGRSESEVQLIAVSKTKPIPMLEEAYRLGCRDFGENKVQELVEKIEVMPEDIRWHMIGHLQTNKVKYIVDKVYLIHSVDTLHLAEAIDREAQKKQMDHPVSILVEVNVAGEESKFGLGCEEAMALVESIAKLPHIRIRGLMTIAPFTDDAESNRIYFKRLRELSVDIKSKKIDNVSMDFLSMGMTGDYEVAISEGADFVRVGTGIFGERNYQLN